MTTIFGMLGAFQGFVLAGAVFSLGGPNRRPNRHLGWLLLILSIAVLTIAGQHGDLLGSSIYPILVESVASLLLPPLLWNYSTTVLGIRRKVPLWFHFLPVILWVSYLLSYRMGWISWRWLPPILLIIGYQAIYTAAVALETWARGSKRQALESHYGILRTWVAALVLVHLAQLIRFFFSDVTMLADIVPLTVTSMLCIVSLQALRQSRLFAGYESRSAATKYASSTLTPERTQEIRALLGRVMEQDKPFLNENLTLADLAYRLKVSRSHLSQVVNESLDCSFTDLLVKYRIREADRLLADPQQRHLTIEDIGYATGFRSRSAFHNAFKRLRGETPGQARRKMSQKTSEDTSNHTQN